MSEDWKNGKYKVTYYMVGNTVVHKWFNTFEEATRFTVYDVKSGDVIEVKWYPNES
jgi:predicted Fe-Mo cluster-binding NifX family protein